VDWRTVAGRIALLVAAAAALGWYYGRPLAAVALALAGLVLYWLLQMRRVQAWLAQPQVPPPDVYGVWGAILAQVYRQRRLAQETEQQLRSTLDFFRDSFASMGEGVVIVNGRGSIVWANGAAERLAGLRFPQDEGQPIGNLIRAPAFQHYLAAGDYVAPLQFSDNGDAGHSLQVAVTRFGRGDRLLFIRDVSAERRQEQVRRDFVANVSHELRTPLTVITGYLDTLLGDADELPERYRRPLQQMLQQSERMEILIRDLLWLSRIEAGEREEKRERVDIAALLEEVQEEVASSHPGREVEFLCDTEQGVCGSHEELHSALSNLVLNAFKYSPRDSPVRVRWCREGGELQLRVEDRGPGIEARHIPRLTERFYRVDDSRAKETGGTGLGLAIVKHVAVSHGAELRIDSKPGEGSCFKLVFPDRKRG
jgi:two-component system phosphate regulon sensor histidine kinase PhoR